MELIYSKRNLGLFVILLLIRKTIGLYSIQCCTGDDNTCSAKPVDCPSNICFKLIFNSTSEERGCLEDLIKLLSPLTNGRIFHDGNELMNTPLVDQCHRLGTYVNEISLCKCTSNLCNSSPTKSIQTLLVFFSICLFFIKFHFIQLIQ